MEGRRRKAQRRMNPKTIVAQPLRSGSPLSREEWADTLFSQVPNLPKWEGDEHGAFATHAVNVVAGLLAKVQCDHCYLADDELQSAWWLLFNAHPILEALNLEVVARQRFNWDNRKTEKADGGVSDQVSSNARRVG